MVWVILIMFMGCRQWEVGRNNDLSNHYELHGWHRYSFINLASVNWELVCVFVCELLNCVRLFVTPWTIVCQVPLSIEFSRQEYWSGLLFPSPGDLLDPGIECMSLMSTCIGKQVLYHQCHLESCMFITILPQNKNPKKCKPKRKQLEVTLWRKFEFR